MCIAARWASRIASFPDRIQVFIALAPIRTASGAGGAMVRLGRGAMGASGVGE
jgi:hypothetical protein